MLVYENQREERERERERGHEVVRGQVPQFQLLNGVSVANWACGTGKDITPAAGSSAMYYHTAYQQSHHHHIPHSSHSSKAIGPAPVRACINAS
jgi:hypothetical protein